MSDLVAAKFADKVRDKVLVVLKLASLLSGVGRWGGYEASVAARYQDLDKLLALCLLGVDGQDGVCAGGRGHGHEGCAAERAPPSSRRWHAPR